uniref:Uncharacterized protein n=1 Tax=Rhizophora mucronata TaxID=61149 RepID=A0A2P2II82_RHIMU
MQSGRISFRES